MTLWCVARIAVAIRRRETTKPRSASLAFTASLERRSGTWGSVRWRFTLRGDDKGAMTPFKWLSSLS